MRRGWITIRHADAIEIARSPKAVISFLADVEQQPRYWAMVERVRLLSGESGQAGTTYERTLRAFGRTRVTVVRIQSIRPPAELVLESLTPPMRVRARMTALARPAGSQLRIELEARISGAARLLAPLVRRRFARNTRQTLERIKELLEAPYHPPDVDETRARHATAPGLDPVPAACTSAVAGVRTHSSQ